ncbi:PIN domain-containing protein [Trametes punicea]|nr:PIN domain-containing protein [Trametes punicea]
MIVIPSVVLSELDGLKNRPELQWFARQATTWLLKKVKERRTVKLQAARETLSPDAAARRPAEGDDVRRNDLAIRDCCLHFADKSRGFGALLVSMDKILCLECQKEGLETCIPPRRSWSSRLLAQSLPVSGIDLSVFHDREAFPRYRPSRTRERLAQTEAPAGPAGPVTVGTDEDMMEIDDGEVWLPEEYMPAHARDSLHAQIAEHFTLVLRDLCYRVHLESGDSMATSDSSHAPEYRRKKLPQWTAELCLSYLRTKRMFTMPDFMGSFLQRRGERGWKKGQDWTPKMWRMVLDALEEVGTRFGDGALLSSVQAVRPHVEDVWAAPLRPV